MRINHRNNSDLILDGRVIERVEEFCYLGSMVSQDGGALRDVISRINKAKGAFAQLRPVWRPPYIRRKTKLRIFDSNVKSVLLYGCETWKVTKDITTRLQTFINRCLRYIMRIWWPKTISNRDLWEATSQSTCLLYTSRDHLQRSLSSCLNLRLLSGFALTCLALRPLGYNCNACFAFGHSLYASVKNYFSRHL